ncbi:DivIVA domain-containing protein [Dactylosporangium sp. NPDC051541]|uniref:DivIVA domain-containing protein n=1 Tax=Dactylosporangium sp. NPDC051541 TaxID=3363977 RepID=UPI0037959E93
MSAVAGEIELSSSSSNGFELSLRGYHRAQVDRYVATLQMRLTTAETELAAARYREQQLTGRAERLSAQLQECRCADESSKAVGGRIQRIIELAEEEAGALRAEAQQDLAGAQVQAEAMLADARRHAEDAMRDFSSALAQRRAEEARVEAGRRAQWDARRRRQREAAENLLATTRSVGTDSVQVTRRLLDALIAEHTKLLAEVETAEKEMANLSSA